MGKVARSVKIRRLCPRTTQSDPSLPVAKNEPAKVPAPDRPNPIWVADITYIETQEGWLYLAGILDLYSRKVAGWNTSDSLPTELVTRAWKKAWKKHRPDPGLLHHSDRGWQYASKEFRSLLAAHQAGASMSRKGNCYDNAAMKSFWAALKTECLGSFIPETRDHAKIMIFDYIECFYNRWRLYSTLGYKSPLDYESQENHKPDLQKSLSTLFRGKIR